MDPSILHDVLSMLIVVLGLVIVILILKAVLMLLIPGAVGVAVYWLTGNLRWAALAFLAVIIVEVLRGKK